MIDRCLSVLLIGLERRVSGLGVVHERSLTDHE